MSTGNEPNAQPRTESGGAGCFLGFGGIAILAVILINVMIVQNNNAIMQNNLRIQENNRRLQELQRQQQQQQFNRQRGW